MKRPAQSVIPSLRLRLLIAGSVAIVLALGLSALGLAALFAEHVQRRATTELAGHLDQVTAGLERTTNDSLYLAGQPADPRFQRPYGGLYWQIADGARPDGGAPLRSRSLWDFAIVLPADDLPDGQVHTHHLPGPAGQTLLTLERAVTLPPRLGGGLVRIVVAMDEQSLTAARTDFIRDLMPYLALLAVTLILAGWIQVTIGLRPLRQIGRRIAAIRTRSATRVGSDLPTEVLPLACELDALLAAREDDVVRARARAGDLAHGLKTPLQALMGEAARLRRSGQDDAAAEIENVVRAMQRHVDHELARTRMAGQAAVEPAVVTDAIRRVVSVIRRTPDGERLEWSLPPAPATPDAAVKAAIDAADLTEILGALIENAARHSAGRVEIAVHPGRDSETPVEIRIGDDGPGIPDTHLERLLQRGARLDERVAPATSGNQGLGDQGFGDQGLGDQGQGNQGLGLAIARDIAQAAGGQLNLRNRDGGGLEACITLPAVK